MRWYLFDSLNIVVCFGEHTQFTAMGLSTVQLWDASQYMYVVGNAVFSVYVEQIHAVI